MCGIAGFYQADFDFTKSDEFLPRLESMKNSLLHRGPDSNDTFLSAHAGLAHARLSIIDLKGGRQPMKKGIKMTQGVTQGIRYVLPLSLITVKYIILLN